MHIIELFALLGILPFQHFYYATVSSQGKYGTTLFIANHAGLCATDHDEGGTDAADDGRVKAGREERKRLDEDFRSIFENARKVLAQLKYRSLPLFVEQPMCLIHRIETNKVKQDLVFCDADSTFYGHLQLFFNIVGTGDGAKVCYYSFKENKWIDFFNFMGMRPAHSWSRRPSLDSRLGLKKEQQLPISPHYTELCR